MSRSRKALTAAFGGFAPALAWTHPATAGAATAPLPGSLEPWVVGALAISAVLYAIGIVRLWRHAGTGRGVRIGQAAAFVAGWLVVVIALAPPLDPLGARLFSAHMLQHELLMTVAAPLLVVGRPLAVWAWALSLGGRRAIGRFFHHPAWRIPWLALTAPLAAWGVHAAVLWLWHVPLLFDAALADEGLHALQHTAFLGSALLFWWSVLGAATRMGQGIALLSLFTTMVHTGALGALLTLAPTAWYAPYRSTAPALGWSPLEDQQLGGLLMWIPAGLIYAGCALRLAVDWLHDGVRPAL